MAGLRVAGARESFLPGCHYENLDGVRSAFEDQRDLDRGRTYRGRGAGAGRALGRREADEPQEPVSSEASRLVGCEAKTRVMFRS